MLLRIRHRTDFRYSEHIRETVMNVWMTPRTDAFQTLRGHRIDVSPTTQLSPFDDWLGNRVHLFTVVDNHDALSVLSQSVVDTHSQRPVPSDANDVLPLGPQNHRVQDFLRFGQLVQRDPRLEALAHKIGLQQQKTAGQIVDRCMRGLADELRYTKGITTSATDVSHALDQGGGVCQDLAHVAIALMRTCGIPTRYVSGYLYKPGSSEAETHAWCEALLPSLGWVGFDPTQRRPIGPGHVVLAVGRDFADVTPNRGTFLGKADESIAVTVAFEEVDKVPDGLLAPRFAAPFAAGLSKPAPGPHHEQLTYDQDQQQQ